MEKDISLNYEYLSEEEDEKQRITSPNEIRFVMHHIAEHGNRVALYYGTERDFILTTMLAVDDSRIFLEQSPHPSVNLRIINSDRLIFVSSHQQIKVQFRADRARNVEYHGHPAFHLSMPVSIHRMQRREFFRLATPVINPLRCTIEKEAPSGKESHKYVVFDISVGGIGLNCSESDTLLAPESANLKFQIELPDLGIIKGPILVRNQVVLTSASGLVHKRVGCEFGNLDGASSVLLQRYVTNMQRKKN